MDGELLRNNKMTERKQRLNQVAEKFGSDIIYAFGSHAKEVAEWLKGERSGLSISSLSDVDVGVKPSSGRQFSVKEKVHLGMALEDLFSVNRMDLVVITEVAPSLQRTSSGEKEYIAWMNMKRMNTSFTF